MSHRSALANTIADLAEELGLSDVSCSLGDEIEELVIPHLQRFAKHPNWPTRLTAHAPFELSVAISPDGTSSVRYTLDVTDYRISLARNWPGYIAAVSAFVGHGTSRDGQIHQLVAQHLDGCPEQLRLRMIHGAGYDIRGRQARIYFSTSWLSFAAFERRLPAAASLITGVCRERALPLPDEVSGVAYDVAEDITHPTRTRTYVWLPAPLQAKPLADVVGEHPDLVIASEIHNSFLGASGADRMPRPLLWSLSRSAGERLIREKIDFVCAGWGWHAVDGLAELLAYLSEGAAPATSKLQTVLRVFGAHRIRLRPDVVGIGPGASFTFYFVPVVDWPQITRTGAPRTAERSCAATGSRASTRQAVTTAILRRAAGYLLARRNRDGSWSSSAPALGCAENARVERWTTSFIAAVLARDPSAAARLGPTNAYLQTSWRADPRTFIDDLETLALSIVAARRQGGLPIPSIRNLLVNGLDSGGHVDGSSGAANNESVAGALHALDGADEASGLAAALTARQRADGAWTATRWTDDLLSTAMCVRALATFIGQAAPSDPLKSTVSRASQAVRGHVAARVVTNEPLLLGSWLSCWIGAGGIPAHPSIDRVLDELLLQQQPDGRWLSTPPRLITHAAGAATKHESLLADEDCLITTAVVADGLQDLLDALNASEP